MGSVASAWNEKLTKLVVAPEQAKELPPVSKDDKDFLYARYVSGTASSGISRIGGTKVHVLSTRSTSEPEVVKGMRASMGSGSGDEEEEEVDREQCQCRRFRARLVLVSPSRRGGAATYPMWVCCESEG
jgi:hypothetical protein